MISVAEAKSIIRCNLKEPQICQCNLYQAGGLVLANSLFSPINMPPFAQSAMDGYALKFSELSPSLPLTIVGEIQAGGFPLTAYPNGGAVRIFTGAPVPEIYDTVVMQEKTRVHDNLLVVLDEQMKAGANVRPQASQNKKGDLVLEAGVRINAGISGYLAGLGFAEVPVFQPPRISILNTGNELQSPGTPLLPGKIYESNSYSLNAALAQFGLHPKKIESCPDDELALQELISSRLTDSDILILTGGVSVGEYDYVSRALGSCGVSCLFHKVKQKPGKPLYFGKKSDTLVFGLPGNPAAVLTCFYEYLVPVLTHLLGMPPTEKKLLPLASGYTKKTGLTHFLKGKINNAEVIALPAQESYLMNTFALANCIIQLEEEKTEFKAGDLVEVHLIN